MYLFDVNSDFSVCCAREDRPGWICVGCCSETTWLLWWLLWYSLPSTQTGLAPHRHFVYYLKCKGQISEFTIYIICSVDLAAIPDFQSGAMENWGLTTYRESGLLFDPHKSSASDKLGITMIIAHELAHQVNLRHQLTIFCVIGCILVIIYANDMLLWSINELFIRYLFLSVVW